MNEDRILEYVHSLELIRKKTYAKKPLDSVQLNISHQLKTWKWIHYMCLIPCYNYMIGITLSVSFDVLRAVYILRTKYFSTRETLRAAQAVAFPHANCPSQSFLMCLLYICVPVNKLNVNYFNVFQNCY